MIKLIKQKWKEGKELQLSNKDVVMHIIKEFTIYPIQNRWREFIINRYGRDFYVFKQVIKGDVDWVVENSLKFLYYESKQNTKKELLDRFMIAVKLLQDYQNIVTHSGRLLKTKSHTEQYHKATRKLYGESSIFTSRFHCDWDCKSCNKFIKEESDKIRKQLKLK